MSLLRKYCNPLFIVYIYITIIAISYVNTSLVYLKRMPKNNYSLAFIIVFWLFGIMLNITLITTILNDPGKVPTNWGFYLDDMEQKKRRFCLICHIFKPERCHHCSACNRCVLNMDHHCPWINSCVGFYNRKSFLQSLFYVILSTSMSIIGTGYTIIEITKNLTISLQTELIESIFLLVSFLISCFICFTITKFLKFHIDLVLANRTTIESLEKKNAEETGQKVFSRSVYDIGAYYNWSQVFGTNCLLWLIPIGTPVGDGIMWSKNQQVELEMKQANKQQ